MDREGIIECWEYEDLSPDMQLVADAAGMEIAKALILTLDGFRPYIDKLNMNDKVNLRYLTKKNKNCKHPFRLAQAIGRSEAHVTRLLKQIIEEQ